jgi:hypothetical protein
MNDPATFELSPMSFATMIEGYRVTLAGLRPSMRSMGLAYLQRLLPAAGLRPIQVALVIAGIRKDLGVPIEPGERLVGEELEDLRARLVDTSALLGLVTMVDGTAGSESST